MRAALTHSSHGASLQRGLDIEPAAFSLRDGVYAWKDVFCAFKTINHYLSVILLHLIFVFFVCVYFEIETQIEVKVEMVEKIVRTTATPLPPSKGWEKQQWKKKITQWKLMKSHKLMRGKLQRRGVSAFSLAFSLRSGRDKNGLGQDFTLSEDGRLHAVQ